MPAPRRSRDRVPEPSRFPAAASLRPRCCLCRRPARLLDAARSGSSAGAWRASRWRGCSTARTTSRCSRRATRSAGTSAASTSSLDGHEFVVDMGAQYFHPGPYPVYTTLLGQLGLFDPNAVEQSAAHALPRLDHADRRRERDAALRLAGPARPLVAVPRAVELGGSLGLRRSGSWPRRRARI